MTGYENGYYIWQRLPISEGLVMREDLEYNYQCHRGGFQGVETPKRYQVAIWIDGKGYDVLYYSGCMVEALEVYELTKQLQTL